MKGEGNQQDYGFRIYDPRIGKFLSVDPLTAKYAYYTPSQFSGNKPIYAVDVDGREDDPYSIGKAVSDNRAWEAKVRQQDPEHAEERIYEANKNAFLFVGSSMAAGNSGLFTFFLDGVLLHGVYKTTSGIIKQDQASINDGMHSVMFVALNEIGGIILGKATSGIIRVSKSIFPSGTASKFPVKNFDFSKANFAEFLDDAIRTTDQPLTVIADLGEGRIFHHFTDEAAVAGITGVGVEQLGALKAGESLIVSELKFGTGSTNFWQELGALEKYSLRTWRFPLRKASWGGLVCLSLRESNNIQSVFRKLVHLNRE
ncbi:RHS repeat-associated core domain-containing protein [Chitinophaga sp. CF418]|nr:RHS repeat-associated core domain-containing protein [Chitinophaga sp. CF418]